MVSFDVASLFINIPLDETVNIILDNLFSGTDEVQVEIVSLVSLSLRSCLNLQ